MAGNVQSWSLIVLSCLMLTVESQSELVKDLKCSIHSLERTHCSWRPASAASNISFYYDLVDESGATWADDDVPSFRECPSYTYTDGVRTGCDLQAHRIEIAVDIIINGSSKNGHNTFRRKLWTSVMPPKLDVTLNKTKDHLYITWNCPDIGDWHKWTFNVKYNTCKAEQLSTGNERSLTLALGSTCPYRVQVKGRYRDGGETPWSDVYEAKADEKAGSNALIYASIIIPMTLAVLAVLACVCCQRNKHIIFPKVPEPRDFLSEISNNNNNNKSTADNLYIPEKEEENCEIILVTDPQDKQAALIAHTC